MSFALTLKTRYEFDCYRGGALLWSDAFNNLVVTVGRNKVLDAVFLTGITALEWFVGLVDSASFSAYAASDTMASHPGWIECIVYDEATRPAYVPVAASLASMSNAASRALFTMNDAATVKGAFLVNDDAVGGAGGVLYGEGSFSVPRDVIAGDVLSVKATLTD